jgi:hypothetical protein
MPKDLTRLMTDDSLGKTIQRVEAEIARNKRRNKRPETLDQLTSNLGTLEYGEFRVGNGNAPDSGFTGVRMLYPGATYGGEVYNLAGVNDDVLQWGGRLSDGVFIAGAGKVQIDVDGITLIDDGDTGTVNAITWNDTSGDGISKIITYVSGSPTLEVEVNQDNEYDASGLSLRTQGGTAIGSGGESVQLILQTFQTAGESFFRMFHTPTYGNFFYFDSGDGEIRLNDAGADLDTRIEGDTDTHLIFADASVDNVGIGEPTPLAKLQVDGDVAINRQDATISSGSIAATHSYIRVNGEGGLADDLVTVTGLITGAIYIFEKLTASGTVTVKDGTGSFNLAGSADFALTTARDKLICIARNTANLDEISRSTN